MFFDDHKKAVATMIAKRRGAINSTPISMKSQMSREENGEIDGRHAAAEDAIAAFHEKDPHKVIKALSNYIDIHNSRSKDESSSVEADAKNEQPAESREQE